MAEGSAPRVTLGSFTLPNSDSVRATISRPATEAHNFEIKPALVNLVSQSQFGGGALEDPNNHVSHFLSLCDTVRIQGVPEDTIRLMLFQFSLRDRALDWIRSVPPGSISTWKDCLSKFLTKFFPPSKVAKLRNDIVSFKQRPDENLYEAWERFKDMVRKCPSQALPDFIKLHSFLNGLDASTKCIIDASAGGSINSKTIEEAQELIEIVAENHYQGREEKKASQKGVYEIDTMTALLAQNKAMSQQIASLTKHLEGLAPIEPKHAIACTICGNNHMDGACVGLEDVVAQQCNYMGNFQRQQYPNNGAPQNNNFGQGWRQGDNRQQWRGNRQFQSPYNGESSDGATKLSPLEVALEKLTSHTSNFIKQTTSFMEETRSNQKSNEASLKNLETQLGQLAKQVAERPLGRFPSNTEGPN